MGEVSRQAFGWMDLYVGDAQSLIAHGLVRADELPGQPGRGRVMCSIEADGSPAAVGSSVVKPGRRRIVKRGRDKYEVRVHAGTDAIWRALAADRERMLAGLAHGHDCPPAPRPRPALRLVTSTHRATASTGPRPALSLVQPAE